MTARFFDATSELGITARCRKDGTELSAYPLMQGDLLRLDDDGTWWKVSPGLQVGGFQLEPDDERLRELSDDELRRLRVVIDR